MPPTPYDSYRYPLVLLRVGGAPAGDIVERMESFEFHDHVKKHDMAKLTIIDVEGKFINDPRFESDMFWELRWGYPSDLSAMRSLRLKYFEPMFEENNVIKLQVTLMGAGAELKRVKKGQNYGTKSSSDVAKAIAKQYKFKTRIEDSLDKDLPIIQPQTMDDFEFLQMLADRIDYEFFIERGTLYFRSKEAARSEAPRLLFTYGGLGSSLIKSFTPTIKATKGTKSKVAGADTSKGKKDPSEKSTSTDNPLKGVLGEATPQSANPVDKNARPSTDTTKTINKGGGKVVINANSGELVALPKASQDDAANIVTLTPEMNPKKVKKLAQAKRRDALEAAVSARAEFIGTPRIRTRVTYGIRGIDRRLSGLWYATEAIHKIRDKSYSVETELRKGAYGKKTNVPSKQSKNTNSAPQTTNQVQSKLVYNGSTGKQSGAEDAQQGRSYAVGDK